MALDVQTLRDTFALVAERAPNLTRRFYVILFERHPEVRVLFGAALDRQEEMLTRALAAVVDRVDDGAWLESTLRALGAKHVDYGVTDEMYDFVGDALLTALEEALAEAWTPAAASAWQEAYGAISALMIEGARSVAFRSSAAVSIASPA